MRVTVRQLKMARTLLDWHQADIAGESGVSLPTIKNIESRRSMPNLETLDKIITAYEKAGVEFIESDGVRRKRDEIITYRNRNGFINFIWDVYETVKKHGGVICVSNVDETVFTDALGKENDDEYMAAMRTLKKTQSFEFKILIKEGDTNYIASNYAEYRWVPKEQFFTVPFYVYGDKLAFLLFEESGTTIHVMENKEIANAQRVQFNFVWENAIAPGKK